MELSLLTGRGDRDWGTEAETDVLPAVSATGTSAVIDADTGAVVAVVAATLEVIVAVDVGNRTDDAGTDAVSSVPGLFLFTATVLAGVVVTALAERAVVPPGEVEGTPVLLTVTVTGAVPVAEGTFVTGVLAVMGVAAVGVTEVVTAVGVVVTTTGAGAGADAAGVVVDAGGADVTAATDDISVGERAAAVTAAMAAELLAAALAALVFATLRAFSAVARRCNES